MYWKSLYYMESEAARGCGQVRPVPHLNLSVPHLINAIMPKSNSLCPTCDAFVPHQWRMASAATAWNYECQLEACDLV